MSTKSIANLPKKGIRPVVKTINETPTKESAQFDALKRFIKDLEDKTMLEKQQHLKSQLVTQKAR